MADWEASPDWKASLLEGLPPALVAFVIDLKLPPRYAIALDELGYDDVDDLPNLDMLPYD